MVSDWADDAGAWSIDPVRVVGAISLVDAEGPALEAAVETMYGLANDTGLSIGGRTALPGALAAFLGERERVPGKFIHYANTATRAVSDAAVSVVVGDENMVDNVNALFRHPTGDVRDLVKQDPEFAGGWAG